MVVVAGVVEWAECGGWGVGMGGCGYGFPLKGKGEGGTARVALE